MESEHLANPEMLAFLKICEGQNHGMGIYGHAPFPQHRCPRAHNPLAPPRKIQELGMLGYHCSHVDMSPSIRFGRLPGLVHNTCKTVQEVLPVPDQNGFFGLVETSGSKSSILGKKWKTHF